MRGCVKRRTLSCMNPQLQRVRPPAVAGIFYPGGASTLAANVDGLLAGVITQSAGRLRALICPHAGYRYSGPTAAEAFGQIRGQSFDHVLVMGPSHRAAFRGVAIADADAFETPLGKLPLTAALDVLAKSKPFLLANGPHEEEHSLEVELPFLQRTLTKFSLTPLVFGAVDEEAVAKALNDWVSPSTLIIASSDLSHYHAYDEAVSLDRLTLDMILRLDAEAVCHAEACGRSPVAALLYMARWNSWEARLLNYKNSGDTSGERGRVVGYWAIGFYETKLPQI